MSPNTWISREAAESNTQQNVGSTCTTLYNACRMHVECMYNACTMHVECMYKKMHVEWGEEGIPREAGEGNM